MKKTGYRLVESAKAAFSRARYAAVLAIGALLVSPAPAAAQTPLKIVNYNTHHGGTASSPASTEAQLDLIAAQNPDVVFLQEVYSTQLSVYAKGLNDRLGTDQWHGTFAGHCKSGTEPTCTSYSSEGVMVLTKLKTVAANTRVIWGRDDYFAGRGVVRMNVALADGTQVNVFSMHLPALIAYRSARVTYVKSFTAWASSFPGPKVMGGDFNDVPNTTPMVEMSKTFTDGWLVAGSGSGYTHIKNGTPYRRIDYLFSDKASNVAVKSITVVGNPVYSDHLALVATYALPGPPTAPAVPAAPAETTLMRDGFDRADATLWPDAVLTGSRDTAVRVGVAGSMLRIDLLENTIGSHYNGISTSAYNLASNGCMAVQLVTPPALSTTAYAMFAVAADTNNYYRWHEAAGELVAERRVGGTKTRLANLQYDATAHQFLRIRRSANTATGTIDVVFETAANNNGVPGTWTERHRETWNASVNATALKGELKAGTSLAEVAPGSMFWDNFHAAVSCR
jgi:endonuclease/exonuclease/phosphatase family metal-dependent hydrolase